MAARAWGTGADAIPKTNSRNLTPARAGVLRSCALWILVLLISGAANAQVAVRQQEGLVHGFLALRTLEGETLADGDLMQTAHGDRVTTRLVFHFKDGSLHEETAVFSQHRHFRLVS